MFKWAMLLLAFVSVAGALAGMGVGGTALAELLLALSLMAGVAFLISWPCLRRASRLNEPRTR